MPKTSQQIRDDIIDNFESRIGTSIEDGSVIDLFTTVISRSFADMYSEIDRNRTPHIWTSMSGKQLDDMGHMLSLGRNNIQGEGDSNYRYRLMNWVLSHEASNYTAIHDALLLPTYASNIEIQPGVRGCGTAVCYVLPREYTASNISDSLLEAKAIVESIASPSLFVEYITPRVLGVQLQVYMESSQGDTTAIKSNIETNIMSYINAIPPYSYLQVGQLNRIGLAEAYVDYFQVTTVIIDGITNTNTAILQSIDTKLLFDSILWTGDM